MKLSLLHEQVVGHWEVVYDHPGLTPEAKKALKGSQRKGKKRAKKKRSKVADYDSKSKARKQNLSFRVDK